MSEHNTVKIDDIEVGAMPKDARSPKERRAGLDPSLRDLLDTLAGEVAGGSLDAMPNVLSTTIAQLRAWGFDPLGGEWVIDTVAQWEDNDGTG